MATGSVTSPLVERTRRRLESELSKKQFRSEAPLPTQRQWAKKLGVSQFIVHRALGLLKQQGLVEARQGSYTFLCSLPTVQPARISPTARVSLWAYDRKDFWKMRLAIVRRRFQQQFRQRHPQVEFDEQQVELRAAEMEARLIQSVLSGPEPTLAGTTQTCLSFLHEHGAVAPFEAGALSDYLEKIRPRYVRAAMRDGQLYLLPNSLSQSLLVYQKELFQRAGLDPERAPGDWEELEQFAAKISAATGGEPSLHIAGGPAFAAWLMELTYQTMPAWAGDTPPPIAWRSEAARQAARFAMRLLERNLLKIHFRGQPNYLARGLNGELALVVMDWGMVANAAALGQADRLGIAPSPKSPNGRTISLMNLGGWLANAHATAAQQRATMEYALAWERWQHDDVGGDVLNSLGCAPGLISLFQDRRQDRAALKNLPAGWQQTLDVIEANSFWEPAEADWQKIALGQAAEELLGEGHLVTAERLLHYFTLREHEAGFGKSIPQFRA